MTTTAHPVDVAAVQRRTVRALVAGQAVLSMGISIGAATAALLAREISGSDTLAGLAQTCQVLGAAIAAIWIARVVARRGRRVGQVTGLLVGAVGAYLAAIAGILGSLPLLLLGVLMVGSVTAANAAARYAATDLATDDQRGRALATVVWASTVGAVLGPNLTGPAGRLAGRGGLPELTGPFLLAGTGVLVGALVIWVRLRPDPLLTARRLAGEAVVPTGSPAGTAWGRAVAAVVGNRSLTAAVVALLSAHAVMVSVMVMTPLHMEHGGASLSVIGFVISVHVLGMFAFSPLMGWAADRLGRPRTMIAGAAVLLASLVLAGRAPEGHSTQITAGLFLLGLGWSAVTVAGSTAVADEAPLESRTDVQGLADASMWLAAAAGGGLSGVVVGTWGFPALTVFAAVPACVVALAATVAAREAGPRHAGA